MSEVEPGIDPTRLANAYGNSDKFEARRSIYDHRPEPLDFVGWALEHVTLLDNQRILDVGCGPGHFLQRLVGGARNVTAIGVDLSPGMAKEAREKGGVTAAASAHELPFPDASFDLVLAMHMLYHVPDIERAVRELRRVTRTTGLVLVSTLSRVHLAKLRRLADAVTGERRLPRPSDRFHLDNGAGYLRTAFSSVEVDRVGGDIVLQDAAPAVAFLDSGRDFYEPFLRGGRSWDDVLADVDRALTDELALVGELRIATEMGVFVCH